MVFPILSRMGSLAAIQLLVQEDFSDYCDEENHRHKKKRILRFKSCDTVCARCTYDEEEPTIEVIRVRGRNAVRFDDITKFVDCSLIQTKYVATDMIIQLKANHKVGKCEVDNFCSLACKVKNVMHRFGTLSSIDKLQIRVRKKRTGGRRRGEVTLFHRFFMMIFVNRKARSRGRIRRTYRTIVEGNIPPKKRNRGK